MASQRFGAYKSGIPTTGTDPALPITGMDGVYAALSGMMPEEKRCGIEDGFAPSKDVWGDEVYSTVTAVCNFQLSETNKHVLCTVMVCQ